MKKYVHREPNIPRVYLKDVMELREFIMNNMGIEISPADTYKFWSDVSESWCAGWLSITACYEDMPRTEFLRMQMEKFGCILNC